MKKQSLVSFHIVERESSQQNLVTWTYPTITDEIAAYLKARCFPKSCANAKLFFYLRKNNLWIYVKDFLYKEKPVALVVISEELIPAKYKLLCDIFEKTYVKTKNSVDLVKLFLKLVCGGRICYQENGSEIGLNLKNFTAEFGLKELISDFGLEIILIYNALLLKRRILLYHRDIEKLQEKLVAITKLVTNRNMNEYVMPWVENVNEIKGISFYLAGTIEENALNNERHYDLYVNLLTSEITIAKGAKECFVMAKFHKDLAHFLVQLSESDLNETRVIEEIRDKTNGLIQQLYSIATLVDNKKLVTISNLKSKKYNAPLENFLFHLAIAENIMML